MPARTLICSLVLTLLLIASNSFSTVIYVKWDATGANNGTSWADAYTDLQTAIGAATPTDDIWIAAGTYKPTGGTDRTIAFEIDNRNLFGGFIGTETSIGERNIAANPTTLSGDIGVQMNFGDNSYNVLRTALLESSFTLDGFTIRDGNANASLDYTNGGGGYFDEPLGAVFRNLIVEDSYGGLGGGITTDHCRGCSWDNVTFRNNLSARGGGLNHFFTYGGNNDHMMTNTVFDNNTGTVRGGGATVRDMILTDIFVTGNSSDEGGGLYAETSVLTRVSFIGNEADERGGGLESRRSELTECEFRSNVASRGGGLSAGNNWEINITDTDFIGNHATDSGGAVYLHWRYGPSFVSCTTDSNTAANYGGAVYTAGPDPSFVLCEMRDNTANRGGAIAASDAGTIITVTRGTMTGNTAYVAGGAIYAKEVGEIVIGSSLILNNNAGNSGGAAADDGGMITLVNNTLHGNSAGVNGGGVAALGGGTLNVSNSILWDNTAPANPESYYLAGVLVFDHSDIKGSGGSGSWDISFGTDGGANIDADPAFVNAASEDFHLTPVSPCIELGDQYNPFLPTEDLDGNPRTQGVNPDMGCYESSSYCPGVARLCVNEASLVNGPGTSWPAAFQRLEDALSTAQICPGITEIWVAEGTYIPAVDGDRGKSFALQDSVALYGGFAGSESSLSERQLSDRTTILSGEIGAAGVEDNSYHVVTCGAVSSETILDGFTITAGNADGLFPLDRGGGMYNFGGSPTIRNIIFDGNTALMDGGGLSSLTGLGVRLINVIFTGNTAFQNGGALANSIHDAVLTNVTFYGNSSVLGAVIYNNSSNLTITNCILWGNTGPLLANMSSTPTFSHCDVEGSGGSGSWDVSLGTDLGNNLDVDPMFVNGAAGDLHLQQSSQAIDSGDNNAPYIASEDLDGRPRVINDIVDMGPYEYDSVTDIGDPPPMLAFRGVYPNPFNPTLTIAFELDRARDVSVAIYSVRGELVRTLFNRNQGPGPHHIQWNGTDGGSQSVASGIYFIVIKSEDWRFQRKAVLLK
jgi:predicted outer membrane repeat protein